MSLCLCVSVFQKKVSVFQKMRGHWKHRGTENTEGSLPVSFKIPPRVSFRSNLCVSVSLCFKKSADIGNTEAQRSRRGNLPVSFRIPPRVSFQSDLCVSVPLCFHPSVLPSSLRRTYTRLFFKLKIDGANLGIVSTRRTEHLACRG